MKNKKLIVVLGMHRSGTSILTKGLEIVGASLGNDFIKPIKGVNDKGFFEDEEINKLNIELLKAVNSDWYFIEQINDDAFEQLRSQGYIQKAVDLLTKKMASVEIFAFKDPRTSKLLPFWRHVFSKLNINVLYVLSIRHPKSVVKSLSKRDGLAAVHSYLLWISYVLESLKGSSGHPRVMVDYDNLIENPELQIKRIASIFNLEFNSIKFEFYKNEFHDSSLRNSTYEYNDLINDPSSPVLAQEIFKILCNITNTETFVDEGLLDQELQIWVREFEYSRLYFNLVDHQYKTALILNNKFVKTTKNYEKDIVDRDALITNYEKDIVDRDALITNYEKDIVDRDALITNYEKDIVDRDALIINYEKDIVDRDALIINYEKDIVDRN